MKEDRFLRSKGDNFSTKWELIFSEGSEGPGHQDRRLRRKDTFFKIQTLAGMGGVLADRESHEANEKMKKGPGTVGTQVGLQRVSSAGTCLWPCESKDRGDL